MLNFTFSTRLPHNYRRNLGHIITSDGHSKKAIRGTNKAITSVDSTLGGKQDTKNLNINSLVRFMRDL